MGAEQLSLTVSVPANQLGNADQVQRTIEGGLDASCLLYGVQITTCVLWDKDFTTRDTVLEYPPQEEPERIAWYSLEISIDVPEGYGTNDSRIHAIQRYFRASKLFTILDYSDAAYHRELMEREKHEEEQRRRMEIEKRKEQPLAVHLL